MQKAAEDLKKQQEAEAVEKRRIIEQRVPKLDLEGMGEGKHKIACRKLARMDDNSYFFACRKQIK